MKYADKNVLIISHNPLSKVNNNGKTLVSILKGVPDSNIYQIYLTSEIPDYSEQCHYLQINEKQILSSLLHFKNLCCNEIESTPDKVSSIKITNHNFANHAKRLIREGIWKFALWQSKLQTWLKDKHFDVVFFMAGDGLFAYDIYHFVMNHTSAKGCLFFTDDYIIGKSSRSPFASLRRNLLKNKIKNTLKSVDELYVISEEMKIAYAELFQRKGYVIRNFSVERNNRIYQNDSNSTKDKLIMVYAGGLHYNRWKVLAQIAKELNELNKVNDIKCCLHIYSSQNIEDEIINQIEIDNASKFCGSAAASQIADIYAKSDILLHVESFEDKAIASTKYSFSTKIPEYLSAGKCVLAVGPDEVASMRYLANFACVITNQISITETLNKLINDNNYRDYIKHNCEQQFENDFSTKKQEECLARILAVS